MRILIITSPNFTYDNNGNMLTVTGGLSNTWNFKNQLTQAVLGGVTTTYAYDHAGQRVKYANGTTTTIYPGKGYNTDGTTPVKHIYAGSTLVATVKGTGVSAAVFSVHNDHLSGSNVVTNSGGTQEEVMDYFPYGNIRLDNKAGSFDEQRKFSGHEYDADTQLSYMNARYYKSDIGRFISQDPMFWNVEKNIDDPQLQNSYSYARNNPMFNIDPDGKEPTKAQSGTIGNFSRLLNSSPSKVGQLKGDSARNYLIKAGGTQFNFAHFRPEPTESYYNTLETRYVYTESGGWIDLAHFMFYAGRATQYAQEGAIDPGSEAVQDGFQQEYTDQFFAGHSAYSYEDLPSDRYGAEFATYYFSTDSPLSLSEQINNYFDVVLNATDPTNAPNYSSIPDKDSKNAPSHINHTTNHIDL